MSTQNLLGEAIAASCEMGLKYGDRMVAGVEPAQFARLASPGGKVVASNHPAFVFGHLSLYPVRVIKALGADSTGLEPSAEFLKVFDRECQCVDDPSGTIYPPMDQVMDRFRKAYAAAAEAIRQADERILAEPNANEAMRARFPTQAAMFNFYLGGHVMMHLGQISAWRRMMGFGPA
jgi:hypothetical protein